jgi:hypothetical protein
MANESAGPGEAATKGTKVGTVTGSTDWGPGAGGKASGSKSGGQTVQGGGRKK